MSTAPSARRQKHHSSFAAFTDAAHAAGMKVIWKPQFVLDDGTNNNVSDWSTGKLFYPSGSTLNVATYMQA